MQGMFPHHIQTYADLEHWIRLSLGLPVVISHGLVTPFGYIRDEVHKNVCWPNDREIRVLRKAYDLLHKGVSYKEVARWVMQNTQRTMSTGTLHNFFKYRRPLCKEVELPLHERERIYKTTCAPTKVAEIIRKAWAEKEVRDAQARKNRTSAGTNPTTTSTAGIAGVETPSESGHGTLSPSGIS